MKPFVCLYIYIYIYIYGGSHLTASKVNSVGYNLLLLLLVSHHAPISPRCHMNERRDPAANHKKSKRSCFYNLGIFGASGDLLRLKKKKTLVTLSF